MIVRLACDDGRKRVEVSDGSTLLQLKTCIAEKFKVPAEKQKLSLNARVFSSGDDAAALASLGVAHGAELVLNYLGDVSPAETVYVPSGVMEAPVSKGDGKERLRDLKMHWRLSDWLAYKSQKEFDIKQQPQAHCPQVAVSSAAGQAFQAYLQSTDFMFARFALLFGYFTEAGVVVESYYEPAQLSQTDSYQLIEDHSLEGVHATAKALGMTMVGCMFSHFPREFPVSALDLRTVSQFHLQALEEHPEAAKSFTFVKVSLNDSRESQFEAYQLSDMYLDMAKDGVFAEAGNTKDTKINEGLVMLVEKKETDVCDNEFFVNNVPIAAYNGVYSETFPVANRPGVDVTTMELKAFLLAADKRVAFVQTLRDFHLLLFLRQLLDAESMARLCQVVLSGNMEECEGFQLLINSFAGIA